jgi:hypothetical protein
VLITGEKRRWFQFLGGWSSPTSPTSVSGPVAIHLEGLGMGGGKAKEACILRGIGSNGQNLGVSTYCYCLKYAPSFLGAAFLVSQPTIDMVFDLFNPIRLPRSVWMEFPILRSDIFILLNLVPCYPIRSLLFREIAPASNPRSMRIDLCHVKQFHTKILTHCYLTINQVVNSHQVAVEACPLSKIISSVALRPL